MWIIFYYSVGGTWWQNLLRYINKYWENCYRFFYYYYCEIFVVLVCGHEILKIYVLQHNWLIDNKMKATPCAIKGTVSRNFLSVFGQFRENIWFVCQSSSVCWVYEWQLKKSFPLFLLKSQWKTFKFFPRWPRCQCRAIVDNADTVNYCMFKNMSAKWLNYLNYLRLFISGRKYCVYFLFKVIQLHTNFNQ